MCVIPKTDAYVCMHECSCIFSACFQTLTHERKFVSMSVLAVLAARAGVFVHHNVGVGACVSSRVPAPVRAWTHVFKLCKQ